MLLGNNVDMVRSLTVLPRRAVALRRPRQVTRVGRSRVWFKVPCTVRRVL